VEIKTKKHFRNLIASLTEELIEEDELEEITTTGDVDGYSTPFAFDPEGEERKKKYKNSLKKVNEALESKDIEIIKKLIRDVIGDVYRDIWIKRNSWK
jgi:hypothetical protein